MVFTTSWTSFPSPLSFSILLSGPIKFFYDSPLVKNFYDSALCESSIPTTLSYTSSTMGIGGSIVDLILWVEMAKKWLSLFNFCTILLRRVLGFHWYKVDDIWPNYCSIIQFNVGCDSTFWLSPQNN